MQDIPSQLPSPLAHDVQHYEDEAHTIEVAPASKLFQIVRDRLDDNRAMRVNSRHHQCLARLGDGLQISATAPDGVVEGAERPDATFCIGVQWHPENVIRGGAVHPLFEAFIQACKDRKGE
jgi:putative glutamine amidotransferase